MIRRILAWGAVAGVLALGNPGTAQAQSITLVNQQNNRCLLVPNGTSQNGALLVVLDCHGGQGQQFSISDGFIRYEDRCVAAFDDGVRNARVGLWDCVDHPSQKWVLQPDGQLRGINGFCIGIDGASSHNGARLVLWDCVNAANQQWRVGSLSSSSSSSSGNAAVVKKLYVIDGTDSNRNHHNSMWHFWEQWDGPKHWQDGVNLMATNIDATYKLVFDAICRDVRPVAQGGLGVTDVYIAGYSRGAFMAIGLANNSRTQCGANVRFVGLVDAVNSSIWNWTNELRAGIPVAVHLRKQAASEHVLTTRDIAGAVTIYALEDVDHQTMTCKKNDNNRVWRWTHEQLTWYATQAGGSFRPLPADATTNC